MRDDTYSEVELGYLTRAVTVYAGSGVAPVLKTAFQIAQDAHHGFQRLSGKPYLSHVLAVAGILAQWKAPPSVVAVGLLHDIFNPRYSQESDLSCVHTLGESTCRLLKAISSLNALITHKSQSGREEE